MMRRFFRSRVRRVAAAAAAVLWAATPAAAQRSAVSGYVGALTNGLRDFVAGPPPPPQPPDVLEACGSLYDPDARAVARGPELLNSYERWIRGVYQVVSQLGPLPVCFERRRSSITSNQGRYLLAANRYYLQRHRNVRFCLWGHTDPVERDSALARLRAEVVKRESPQPHARYATLRARADSAHTWRKVVYQPVLQAPCNHLPRP